MRADNCTADRNNFPAENSSGMLFTAEPSPPEGFYYGKKKSPSQQLCSHSFIAKGFSYIKGEYENLIERKGDGENLSLSFAYMDIIHHDY